MTKGPDMDIRNAADLERAARIYESDLALNPAAIKGAALRYAMSVGDTAFAAGPAMGCPGCPDRTFWTDQAFLDHADTVHTYSDIQQMVGDTIREKFGRQGDYNAKPPIPSIWTYISDITDEWVVYCVDGPTESQLYKATYSIDDGNNVILGDSVEVVRRTVYDEVKPA